MRFVGMSLLIYYAIKLFLSLSPRNVFLASIPVLHDKVLLLASDMTRQIFQIFVDRQPYLQIIYKKGH